MILNKKILSSVSMQSHPNLATAPLEQFDTHGLDKVLSSLYSSAALPETLGQRKFGITPDNKNAASFSLFNFIPFCLIPADNASLVGIGVGLVVGIFMGVKAYYFAVETKERGTIYQSHSSIVETTVYDKSGYKYIKDKVVVEPPLVDTNFIAQLIDYSPTLFGVVVGVTCAVGAYAVIYYYFGPEPKVPPTSPEAPKSPGFEPLGSSGIMPSEAGCSGTYIESSSIELPDSTAGPTAQVALPMKFIDILLNGNRAAEGKLGPEVIGAGQKLVALTNKVYANDGTSYTDRIEICKLLKTIMQQKEKLMAEDSSLIEFLKGNTKSYSSLSEIRHANDPASVTKLSNFFKTELANKQGNSSHVTTQDPIEEIDEVSLLDLDFDDFFRAFLEIFYL